MVVPRSSSLHKRRLPGSEEAAYDGQWYTSGLLGRLQLWYLFFRRVVRDQSSAAKTPYISGQNPSF